MSVQMLARIAHEVNRVATDDTQHNWETAPDWQRQNVLKAVNRILVDPMVEDETLAGILSVPEGEDAWNFDVKLLRAVVNGGS